MRRAIVAAVVGMLMLGGATATTAFAARHGAVKRNGAGQAQPAAHDRAKTVKAKSVKAITVKSKTASLKTVVYHGFEFEVPASWPVYRLDEYPSICVRYDINAVYLGTPGANMRCPATVLGRTETISVIPGVTVAARSGSEITYQREQPGGTGAAVVRSLAAVHGQVRNNANQHELRVALRTALLAVTVLASYGTDPAIDQQVLGTLRTAPKNATATAQSPGSVVRQAADAAPATATAAAAAMAPDSAQPASKSWKGVTSGWPKQIVVWPPAKAPVRPVSGFDTCAAPSLATMRAWRRDYAAAGVYIGGANYGCADGNLTASWLRSAASMGWGMMPTYVGLQAPCTKATNVWIMGYSQAAAEGAVDGRDAVSDARQLGLGAGSPIYYDMEGYDASASCKSAVLRFLGAWDRVVSAAGYRTGVYSSRSSGVEDLQNAALGSAPGFTAPNAIWDAHWDGIRSLSNDGLTAWALSDRIKQYAGNVSQTIGGAQLSIDQDIVAAPLAR